MGAGCRRTLSRVIVECILLLWTLFHEPNREVGPEQLVRLNEDLERFPKSSPTVMFLPDVDSSI